MTFRRAGGSGLRIVLGLAVVLAGSLVLLHVLGPGRPARRAGGPGSGAPTRRGTRSRPASPRIRPAIPEAVAPGGAPVRVAVVIDDVGFDQTVALDFARLGMPLTFAILPEQRYSEELAERLRGMGHEVILHLPMQPLAWPGRDPGQGAVVEGLSPEEVRATVLRDLAGVPGAIGLNNHMGSRITADPAIMRSVLTVARDRGLYFLDSRTTPGTVAYDLAVEMGVPAVRRSVFLDDRRERSYIEAQVRTLLERARAEGSALAIGHPDGATLEALRRSLALLRSPDVRLVPASSLADSEGGGTGS